MKADDILNWSEISRYFTGSRYKIRKDSVPLEYREKINSLLNSIDRCLESS